MLLRVGEGQGDGGVVVMVEAAVVGGVGFDGSIGDYEIFHDPAIMHTYSNKKYDSIRRD